jgi:hypothetical protein
VSAVNAAEAWRSATSETCHHCRGELGFLEGPLCDECVEVLPLEAMPSHPSEHPPRPRSGSFSGYLQVDLTTGTVLQFPHS